MKLKTYHLWFFIATVFVFLTTVTATAQQADSIRLPKHAKIEKIKSKVDTILHREEKRIFELSLGSSLLFISSSRIDSIRKKEAVVVPRSALLFFAEFRPGKKMKIPCFLSLPTGEKQFIVNGQVVSERASPTFGIGLEFRIFKLPLNEKSKVEMEVGPLASILIDQKLRFRFAPLVAGRIRFIKNEDFVIYVGSSYSVGIDAFGILFGTGYVF